jgi:hypothetical protein
MTKRAGGVNRICIPCKKKYPSKFTNDPTSFNVTSVCSDCGGELTNIPDSVAAPKKKDNKGWKELAKAVESNDFSSFYNRAKSQRGDDDVKLSIRNNREKARAQLSMLHSNNPKLVNALLDSIRKNEPKEAVVKIFDKFKINDSKRRSFLLWSVNQAVFWGYKLPKQKAYKGSYYEDV